MLELIFCCSCLNCVVQWLTFWVLWKSTDLLTDYYGSISWLLSFFSFEFRCVTVSVWPCVILFMLLFGQSPDEGNGKLGSPVAGPATTKVTMKPESLVWTKSGNDALLLCFVSSHTVTQAVTTALFCWILERKLDDVPVSEGSPVATPLKNPQRLNVSHVPCEPSYFGLLRAKVLFSVPIMTHDLFTCSQLPRDDNHVSETFRWSLLPHCLVAFVDNISACVAMHGISFSSLRDICLRVL